MINLLDLPRYSTNPADYADQHDPQFVADISAKLNAQAERIEFLMLDIVTSPDHKEINYKDILPWRQRAEYMRNTGKGRAAKRLEKRMALEEARAADEDEALMQGYKEFLDTEFTIS